MTALNPTSRTFACCVFTLVIFLSTPASAQTSTSVNAEILTWSNGSISTRDIDAEIRKAPEAKRVDTKTDTQTVTKIIDSIQVFRELNKRAESAGINRDPILADMLTLARERETATFYLEKQISAHIASLGDLTNVAKERYTVDQKKYLLPERRGLAHILVAARTRTDGEAKAIAEGFSAKLKQTPEEFSELASVNTDDPGSRRRAGVLGMILRGQMVKEFEEAAFALTAEGQLTPPVKSQFGYHIIKLLKIEPARQQTFEEVKTQLVEEITQTASGNYREELIRAIRSDKSLKMNDSAFEAYTGAKRKQ